MRNAGFGGSNSAIILEEVPSRSAANGMNGSSSVNGTSRISVTNGFNGTHAVNGIHGINGTNDINDNEVTARIQRLFVLSARTEKSLISYLSSFDEYLDDAPDSSDFLKNLSYTLGQRRTHHPYRVSAFADSVTSLQEKLLTAKPDRIKDQMIAFAFTGQGAQSVMLSLSLPLLS